ncbi:MAG: hypothetical protein KatS3mg105_1893 [Gemmatales bacterium]|nr:MAG: hypothetical protein KatS3mg105_1893 [Gemmatales bacterium]
MTRRHFRALVLMLWAAALIGGTSVNGQEKKDTKRYNVELELSKFPQSTPKECLKSVLQAIVARRIDYLMAHLADPEFVDARVKKLEGGFDAVVEEARIKLAEDPHRCQRVVPLLPGR